MFFAVTTQFILPFRLTKKSFLYQKLAGKVANAFSYIIVICNFIFLIHLKIKASNILLEFLHYLIRLYEDFKKILEMILLFNFLGRHKNSLIHLFAVLKMYEKLQAHKRTQYGN